MPVNRDVDAGETAAPVERLTELSELAKELASGVAELAAAQKGTQRSVGERFAEEVQTVLGEDEHLDDEAIRRGVRLAVAEQAWQRRLGTLLRSRDVVAALGVSRQRVATLTSQHRLVALPTASGASRYPAWQFKLSPEEREVAARVHRVLVDEGDVSPWTAASWFVERHPAIDDVDPVAAIAAGHEEQVLRAARRDAAAAAR